MSTQPLTVQKTSSWSIVGITSAWSWRSGVTPLAGGGGEVERASSTRQGRATSPAAQAQVVMRICLSMWRFAVVMCQCGLRVAIAALAFFLFAPSRSVACDCAWSVVGELMGSSLSEYRRGLMFGDPDSLLIAVVRVDSTAWIKGLEPCGTEGHGERFVVQTRLLARVRGGGSGETLWLSTGRRRFSDEWESETSCDARAIVGDTLVVGWWPDFSHLSLCSSARVRNGMLGGHSTQASAGALRK
jgi:hypothetical protein